MRIAALTMAYNEPVWAPIWARHYAAQFGPEHCYLLDHGTDDGSLDAMPPIRIEFLPRTPLDETWRAATIARRAEALLQTYDAVLHTDTDELAVADPARFPDLPTLIEATRIPVLTAIGVDVQHCPHDEPALDLASPLGPQRRWLRFAAAMCKPALIRRPVTWCPGFHSCDAPLEFGHLYLLHMRYADLGLALQRLHRTRSQAMAHPDALPHQRVPDQDFAAMVHAIATLPRIEGPLPPLLAPWLQRLTASRMAREHELYKLDLSLSGDALWDGRPLLAAIA